MSSNPFLTGRGVAAVVSTVVVGGGLVALGAGSARGADVLSQQFARSRARAAVLSAPLSFEASGPSRYESRGPGLSLALTPAEAVVTLQKPVRTASQVRKAKTLRGAVRNATVRMRLAGANQRALLQGEKRLPGKINYFRGNDPAKWKTGVSTFGQVRYDEVYPGIDLLYHGSAGALEYDFLVAPGADPDRIRLDFRDDSGKAGIRPTLAEDGSLRVRTAAGDLRHHKPVCYQEKDGTRVPVTGEYQLCKDGTVQFKLGAYDRSQPLVIDPTLAYSTYLGNAAGNANEVGYNIALDPVGMVYVTGVMDPTNSNDDSDVFVAKMDPSVTGQASLIWSTIIGGSKEDSGAFCDMGLAVDSNGSAYVSGCTDSTDFPLVNAYDSTHGNPFLDGFVTKLNTNGTIAYSTFLGGDGWDYPHSIAVDDQGRAHVAGGTGSDNFPLTAGAIQSTNQGGLEDAFVTVFAPNGQSLLFSTLLGGDGTDDAYSINLGADNLIYIGGTTSSSGTKKWPTTANAYQPDHHGFGDAFVAKIDRTKSGSAALLYSTYVGGTSDDNCWGIDADAAGNAYITGVTTSTDFPTLSALQPNKKGTWDAFTTKLSTSGPSTGIIYSTYLGTFHGTRGFDIEVDSNGAAYVLGDTNWGNNIALFPSTNPLSGMTTSPPLGQGDTFVVKYSPAGTSYVYATLLGGSGGDSAFTLALGPGGIAIDSGGNAFIASTTFSLNFPVVNGAQAGLSGGSTSDAFVAVIAEGPLTGLFQPTNLRVTSRTTSSITLGWNDNSRGETSYELERTGGAGGTQTINLAANSSSYTDTNVVSGVTYTYRVRSRLNAQVSAYSSTLNATTAPPAPSAPTTLIATATGPRQITLSWQDTSSTEDSFEIERRLAGGSYTFVAAVGQNTTTYVDNTVKGNQTYEYHVRATNDGGDSAYSNDASATTVEPAPNAPSGVAVTVNSTSQITVRWTDNSNNENEFVVQRRSGAGSFAEVARIPTGTNNFANMGLSPNTSYTYRVLAVGDSGTSAPSNEATGLTQVNAPTSLAVTATGATSATLSWSLTGTAASFKLDRKSGSGSFVELPATISGDARTFTDTGLLSRSSYSYRLRAINAAGSSAPSNTVNVNTLTALASVKLSPTSVVGKKTSKCTVSLAAAAPAGGAVMTVTSNNAAATVPATITVPAGTTSTNFTIKTKKVTRTTTVTITVTYGSQQLSATLKVKK